MLTDTEKRDLTTILEFFYGTHAARFKANEKTAQVIWKMLQEAQKCSEAIKFVPLPTATPPGLSYILKYIAKLAVKVRTQQLSKTCASGVAFRWTTQLDMAAYGI